MVGGIFWVSGSAESGVCRTARLSDSCVVLSNAVVAVVRVQPGRARERSTNEL